MWGICHGSRLTPGVQWLKLDRDDVSFSACFFAQLTHSDFECSLFYVLVTRMWLWRSDV